MTPGSIPKRTGKKSLKCGADYPFEYHSISATRLFFVIIVKIMHGIFE